MATRAENIEALAPRQALNIVQYMTSWLDQRLTDSQELAVGQLPEVFKTLFEEAGYTSLPLSTVMKPNDEAAGTAARQLLQMMAESDDPEVLEELDHWLTKSPEAGTMAVADPVVLPIVLTACFVVLQTGFQFTIKLGKGLVLQGSKAGLGPKEFIAALAKFHGILQDLIVLRH